jgi:hypothetical protein
MTQAEPIPVPEAGSLPLRIRLEELYARARSLNHSPNQAAELAGYAAEHRNGPKIEKRARVAARIAWLIRQEDEVLRIKREEIENWLWLQHRRKISDFYETVEEPVLNAKGKETSAIRRYQRMRLFSELTDDQQACVEGVRYTEGGPALSLYSQMQSNIELRKLNGIGAITKGEEDRRSMPEDALVARISDMLKLFGVVVGEAMSSRIGRE